MFLCHYCGAHAPYSCDAKLDGGGKCGRLVCADHAHPAKAGQGDVGENTRCEDHAALKAAKSGAATFRPTTRFTPLEIDGRTFQLCYDFNAIAIAEKISGYGCNLLQGVASFLVNTAGAVQYRGLLYAALLKAQPKMSIEDAGALVRLDTMPDIRDALLIAYDQSLPGEKKMIRPLGADGVAVDAQPAGSSDPLPGNSSGNSSGVSDASTSD